MQQFVDAFKPVSECTKLLQSDNMAMSDLLIFWYRCERHISKVPESPGLLGELVGDVEARLIKTLRQLKYSATEEPNNAHPQDSDNISSDDDFENFVQLRTSSTTEVSEEQVSIKEKVLQKQLEQKVRQLGSQKKISMKADIFEHYEHLLQSKAIDKDSYQLAMVVLSAPATQVSVERSFSALAIVMDPLRISMKGELIDDILVCALNKVLLDLLDFDMQ